MKLENVNFVYSPNTAYEIHALKNINLEIREGEFIGLIGHTGSGKSTLAKELASHFPSKIFLLKLFCCLVKPAGAYRYVPVYFKLCKNKQNVAEGTFIRYEFISRHRPF